MKDLNRWKVVLAKQKKAGKWLAGELGKDTSIVSKWCSNKKQISNLELLVKRALRITHRDEPVGISAQVLGDYLHNLAYEEILIVDPETAITLDTRKKSNISR